MVTSRRMSGLTLTLSLLLLSMLLTIASLPISVSAGAGDAQIPDGQSTTLDTEQAYRFSFDHEPVIMTKEKLANLKAPKLADAVPPLPPSQGGAAPASQQQQPQQTIQPAIVDPVRSATPAAGGAAAAGGAVPLSPTVPSDGRFAARHSFAAPFSSKLIPYWDLGAGAVVEESRMLRLTPARQSRTGYAWNSQLVEMSDWEVVIEFQVAGRKDFGGDGFAFWFVERPEVLGMVYGSTDYWNGLGVFFDTFNNDGQGASPFISAVFNDGTQKYDASSDGASQAMGSCSADFRNLPLPSLAKLRYVNHALSLELAITREGGRADGALQWTKCFALEGVELGVDKYFGITAHTGDVADSHDIFRVEVHDLSPATIDLDALRKKYAEEVHHKQEEHEVEHSGHALTIDEFQHGVLTMLSQIQEEVNMLNTGHLTLSEWMLAQSESKDHDFNLLRETVLANVASGGGAATSGGSAGQGQGTVDPNAARTQASILTELQNLKTAFSSLPTQVAQQIPTGSGSQATGSATPNSPVTLSSQSTSSLTTSIKDTITPMLSSLLSSETYRSEVNALRERIQSAQSTQQSKVDELAANMAKLQVQIANIQTLLSNGGGGVYGTRSGAAGGSESFLSVGWVMYLCVIFSALMTFVLTLHSYHQHKSAKDRWKLT